jgi:transposase-like protein
MTSSRKTTDKRWTGAEKWRVVLEASQCSASDLGALLRREGLHEVQLANWRAAAEAALAEPAKSVRGRAKPSVEAKRIQVLERELRRKDAALAETAALLVLKKKVLAIWGDGDDSTDLRSGT